MVKPRFRYPAEHTEAERDSARATLWEALRALLGLFAPFAPFITEHLYQRLYRPAEGVASLHLTGWPVVTAEPDAEEVAAIEDLVTVLDQVRALRTRLRLGADTRAATLVLQATDERARRLVAAIAEPLRAAAKVERVVTGEAAHDSGVPGLRVNLLLSPPI